MTTDAKQSALDAIHDEAIKALQTPMPDVVKDSLELIASIARYGFDVGGNSKAGA